jgi:hypothetical protein
VYRPCAQQPANAAKPVNLTHHHMQHLGHDRSAQCEACTSTTLRVSTMSPPRCNPQHWFS